MDETKKNRNNDGLFDEVFDLAEAALVIGAGAASLYKSMSGKSFSEFTSKYRIFKNELSADLLEEPMNNLDDYLNFSKRINKVWNKTIDNYSPSYHFGDSSLMKRLSESIRMEESNLDQTRISGYLFNFGNNELKSLIDNSKTILNHNEKIDVQNMISYASKNIDNEFAVATGMEKIFYDNSSSEAAKIAQNIIEKMTEESKKPINELIPGIKDATTHLEKEIAEKLRDPEEILEDQKNNGLLKLLDSFSGESRTATLGDILEKSENKSAAVKKEVLDQISLSGTFRTKEGARSFKDVLEGWYENLSDHKKIKADDIKLEGLRINKSGNIYSIADTIDGIKHIADESGNTLIGRLLKVRDISYTFNQPTTAYFKTGTHDMVLSQALGNKPGDFFTKSDAIRIGKKTYQIIGNSLKEIKELEQSILLPSHFGTSGRMNEIMSGAARSEEFNLSNQIDGIGFSFNRKTEHDKYIEEKVGSNIKRYINSSESTQEELLKLSQSGTKKELVEEAARLMRLNLFLNKNSYALTDESVHNLRSVLKKDGSLEYRKILDQLMMLSNGDQKKTMENILAPYSHLTLNRFENKNLAAMLGQYMRDPEKALSAYFSKTSQYADIRSNAKTTGNYFENLKTELTKEMFLRYEKEHGVNALQELIENNLSGKQLKNARQLSAVALWDKILGMPNIAKSNQEYVKGALKQVVEINKDLKNPRYKYIADGLTELEKERSRSIDLYKTDRFKEGLKKENYFFINNAQLNPLSDISILNKSIRNRAENNTTSFVGQFIIGGANHTKHYSMLSMASSFFFDRLNRDLKFGFNTRHFDFHANIGLKETDMTSAGAIVKNAMLKRFLPIGAAYTYFDWLDDTSKEVFGTGVTEAAASSAAAMYLGAKKVTGAFGMDEGLKSLSSDNVILDYYSGFSGDEGGEWNTYEEQKKYYESGYTAIRKGRFWIFGSANEFRGKQIAYWEPNSLRTISNKYKDKSLYGSYWNKWSHSLLPTPTNPFSTINYMMDPYYLEKIHKEDRPYAISGPMFSRSTPWGTILNPTIGELIKPRKELQKDRLGEDGKDVKAIIADINRQIRDRNTKNENVLYYQNGKLRSMIFNPYLAPENNENIENYHITDKEVEISSAAQNIYNGGLYISEDGNENTEAGLIPEKLTTKEKIILETAQNKFLNKKIGNNIGLLQIRRLNSQIKQKAGFDTSQGLIIENKAFYETSTIEKMLEDTNIAEELMDTDKGSEYLHDMAVSARLLGGIYGYGINRFADFGSTNKKRIADSGNMESISRSFWDQSVGGTGGETMEIVRRFFPEYRRSSMISPLLNNMPDWIPERFRLGDPYTIIINGEARLPGTGYESLNKLHPDMFGEYGAFDRYKILADISPYSPEYKLWKRIAAKTVMDPELKEQMKEIRERVKGQTKQHDFYNYKYVGRGIDKSRETISEVLDYGKFKIAGSDRTFKLSGVKLKAQEEEISSAETLLKYIRPGQEVVMAVDSNIEYAQNKDKYKTINAAIIVNGENVSDMMVQSGDAEKRIGDISAASYMASHGTIVNGLNYLSEIIGHTQIPVISSRFLRIMDPLEMYKDENIYGVNYQTWSDFYGTFIRPSLQIGASSSGWTAIGIATEIAYNNIVKNEGAIYNTLSRYTNLKMNFGPWTNAAARYSYTFLNRGALLGKFFNEFMYFGSSKQADIEATKSMKIGSKIGLGVAMIAGTKNPTTAALAWGRAGYLLGEKIMKRNKTAATLMGAATGLSIWAQNTSIFSDEKDIWIPDNTKKKWEIDDYFDRLTYIKYMGLYEKAADKALKEENVDIRKIIRQEELRNKNIKDTKNILKETLANLDNDNSQYAESVKEYIRNRYNSLNEEKLVLKSGDYAKTALMFRNVALATMYALDENSSIADIMRALPKTEKDFFMEFVKEKSMEKRQEILKYTSPALTKVLKLVWKMELDKSQSNEDYFEKYTLPAPTWSGWSMNTDLADVQAKVVKNEGMVFSDFGIYESQYRDPDTINAPEITDYKSGNNLLLTRLKLAATMSGMGLDDVDINIEPRNDSGLEVIANVTRVIDYKIEKAIDDIFSIA